MQVASRLLLVWPVIDVFPALATSPAYSSMLVAWSVTEVVRYSYFVLNLSGYQPALVTWLRYNTFYVLYPTGISSECYLIYKAIEPARELRLEYAWALQVILLIYIPGKFVMCWGEHLSHLIVIRLVYPFYAYDGAEAKGYEREGQASTEISIMINRQQESSAWSSKGSAKSAGKVIDFQSQSRHWYPYSVIRDYLTLRASLFGDTSLVRLVTTCRKINDTY